jgi:hypothetical protein
MSDFGPPGTTPQFGTAEYSGLSATDHCKFCNQPVATQYYRVNDAMACASCADQWARSKPKDKHSAYARALGFGIGAALLGMILYAAFGIITGLVIGYLSLAVGYLVGHRAIFQREKVASANAGDTIVSGRRPAHNRRAGKESQLRGRYRLSLAAGTWFSIHGSYGRSDSRFDWPGDSLCGNADRMEAHSRQARGRGLWTFSECRALLELNAESSVHNFS